MVKVEIHPWAKMMPPQETYCYPCDSLVALVRLEEAVSATTCPLCGRSPGALERGLRQMPSPDVVAELEYTYGSRADVRAARESQ